VSVADGSDEAPTGRLLFYLSPLDAVSKAALATGTTAFSVSEAQRLPGGCGSTDPEVRPQRGCCTPSEPRQPPLRAAAPGGPRAPPPCSPPPAGAPPPPNPGPRRPELPPRPPPPPRLVCPVVLQDPTCAKVTLLGRMAPIPNSQLGEAQRMLFERHPAMEAWPADHRFAA